MHPFPNDQILPVQPLVAPPLEFSPPPDDLEINVGEINPGPHEAIQLEGNMQTLHHPILNGILFICTFLFLYLRGFSRHAM